MAEHLFGGDWTEEKLEALEKYLVAYRRIFASNAQARHFHTWYVDAFAGTGSRSLPSGRSTEQHSLSDELYADAEADRYRKGSAKIALGLSNPFDSYLLIEKSASKVVELHAMIETEHSARLSHCDLRHGDANSILRKWSSERNWQKERAVVFLDPYGMQVEWTTVETLGKTKAIDLWYLFPLGIAVLRLLVKDGDIPATWQGRLDSLFGTKEWRTRFYTSHKTSDLFGRRLETIRRNAPPTVIQTFIEERLRTCFARVADGLVLTNSKSNPLYLLCFAAANDRGAPIALRIAQSILRGSKRSGRG